MNTSTVEQVRAIAVRFEGDTLFVQMSDRREVGLPMNTIPWLKWLATASAGQRNNWSIEPGGFAVYWPNLDDGVEISHILSLHALA